MVWWLVACVGTGTTTGDTDVDCETLPGTCGQAALQDSMTGDTGCPEGFACWGPSAFVCYRGTECDLPICLGPDTVIATPAGDVPLRELAAGDRVYTLDAAGRTVIAPVARLGSTPAPAGHRWVQVRLADGRAIAGSAGHPTSDGRRLGDLRAGDPLDGSVVDQAWDEAYPFARTYDLRPASASGAYLADGVWLGSTLR